MWVVQDGKEEPHLSTDQLRACAARALEAALQLVSHCSEVPTSELEKWYRLECSYGTFDKDDGPSEVEDALLEDILIADLVKQALVDHARDACHKYHW